MSTIVSKPKVGRPRKHWPLPPFRLGDELVRGRISGETLVLRARYSREVHRISLQDVWAAASRQELLPLRSP